MVLFCAGRGKQRDGREISLGRDLAGVAAWEEGRREKFAGWFFLGREWLAGRRFWEGRRKEGVARISLGREVRAEGDRRRQGDGF